MAKTINSQKLAGSFFNKTKVARREYGRFKVWEVKVLTDGQRNFLKGLSTKGAIHICNEDSGDTMEILVEGTRSMQVKKLLEDRDISFEVSNCDTTMAVSMPRSPRGRQIKPLPNTSSLINTWKCTKNRSCLDWNDFYSFETVYQWMDEIEKLFPATCTVSIIGNSVEGRPIKMLKISNSDASNSGVWLDGCTHAREWISVSVVTYIADYVARNFGKLPTHMTNKDWFFVPIVNPDGYHFTHTADRMWRKNRARFGNTIVGVDLNRNFGYGWGMVGGETTTTVTGDPMHNNYRGLEAFSEPESRCVKDMILYSGLPFKMFVTFHAYSEAISFPWCFQAEACPDYIDLLEGGAIMAQAIFNTTGRMYKVGNFKDIMYFASGTSIDWSYGVAKIPFSYLIELRSKEHHFALPKEEIKDCCKEILTAIKALTEYVDTKNCQNCSVHRNKLQL